MSTTDKSEMLLQRFPAWLRYPLIGSIPILVLSILGTLGCAFFTLLPMWAIFTVLGIIAAYGVLYWIGYELEHG